MQEKMTFEELQEVVSVCLEEIGTLKQKNAELQYEVDKFIAVAGELVKIEESTMNKVADLSAAVDSDRCVTKIRIDNLNNLKYEIGDPQKHGDAWYFPKFYEIGETVESIVNDKLSMARFGDGEFEIMSGKNRSKFQQFDEKLASRLRQVIESHEEKLLIAIADNYGCLDGYNEIIKPAIRAYMTDEVRVQHKQFLDLTRTYHNAYLSRPYAFWEDNRTQAPKRRFDNLKRIWDGRNVIFVEGILTRMGVGNDLFDNAAKIRRIEAPAVNSFEKYDQILETSCRYAEEDVLFLIALGPAAGVLAYDLSRAGFQAIDIGHLDLEYEWYLNGNGERCAVEHKYNNEFVGGDIVEDIHDEEYEGQIIANLS